MVLVANLEIRVSSTCPSFGSTEGDSPAGRTDLSAAPAGGGLSGRVAHHRQSAERSLRTTVLFAGDNGGRGCR